MHCFCFLKCGLKKVNIVGKWGFSVRQACDPEPGRTYHVHSLPAAACGGVWCGHTVSH